MLDTMANDQSSQKTEILNVGGIWSKSTTSNKCSDKNY